MPTSATPNDQTTQVNTGGGSAIGHDVTIGKGDFVGRDKIEHHYHYHGTPFQASDDPQDALLFIPFPRKSAAEFVGRNDELVELHEKLQQSQIVGVRPAAALTGLGGIGKTQLAVEYAYRYQATYPGGIYWINAADLNRVRSQLVETAERMGLRATDRNTTDNTLLAELVKYCQQQPTTLLCFDNAPDAVILWRRLTQELNTATLGAAILITTRRRDLPPNMAAVDLRRLSDSTVRQLLATARPDLLTDPELPRLLERLGGLPLVVSLVANALRNSPDAAIADYLAALAQHGEETVHEELDVHVADYDLYREVYTRTLLPVLREQWERLCQQPKSENAQLLLRIAGQLPEAAEIPIARLGLLAGLEDGKVIRPLTSAIQSLWKVALIEELKADAIRLHPLVRNFAAGLITVDEHEFFRIACAERLASAFYNIQRLGTEYEQRGISAMMLDLLAAIDVCQSLNSADTIPATYPPRSKPSNRGVLTNLYNFLRIFRLEAHHLQGPSQSWRAERIWQQLLLRSTLPANHNLAQEIINVLQNKPHWSTRWTYQYQEKALEQTLIGHQDNVSIVAVIDEQRIISGSDDGTLRIWNWKIGEVEQTIKVHQTRPLDVKPLNYRYIVASFADRTIKIWDLELGTITKTLVGHKSRIPALQLISTHHCVSASDDGTMRIWNMTNGATERIISGQEIQGHKERILSLALLDEDHIVTGSENGVIKIWELSTGIMRQKLIGHKGSVVSFGVFDHLRIVSASKDRTLKIWNLKTNEIEQTLKGHTACVNSVIVLAQDKIVSASDDNTLRVWDLNTSRTIGIIRGHESWVNAIAKLQNNKIVSASNDLTLKVWTIDRYLDLEINSERQITEKIFRGHTSSIHAIIVTENNRMVSASTDQMVKVWKLETGEIEHSLRLDIGEILALEVFDQKNVILTISDGTIMLCDVESGVLKQAFTVDPSSEELEAITLLKKIGSNRFLGVFDDYVIKIWNFEPGSEGPIQVEQIFTDEDGAEILDIVLLEPNRQIVAASGHKLKIWDIETGQIVKELRDHKKKVSSVAMLDSNRLVSASYDQTIKIWNLEHGEVEQTLVGHTAGISTVVVLDARHIVSASHDRTLRVWDTQKGKEIASIGLDSSIQCAVVTHLYDRTLVVAGDAGGALYCLELVEPVAGGQ